MRVLVIGGGGREHALVWKLSQSPRAPELFCAPGNPGIRELAKPVDVDSSQLGLLAAWAVNAKIDLTVVGPEAPLAEGIVDVFTSHGLKIFGPTKAAAQLEASKAFAKEIMQKAGVPTAKSGTFDDFNSAKRYVESLPGPYVIKADGLAAGKGVVIAPTREEAISCLEEFMVKGLHGSSGSIVVIEEFLRGREASIIALVDDTVVLPLVVSQDFKRVGDNDTGLNTGGMGAISPTPVLSDQRVENLIGTIFLPVLREMQHRGIRYTGFLYAGVMVDPSGVPYVLEFNCRSGDPETEPIMMRLTSDPLQAFEAAVQNNLSSVSLRWSADAAACVIMSSRGYPGVVDDGKEITGLFPGEPDLQVFHCGTVTGTGEDGGKIYTKGGRILAVCGRGPSVSAAVERAYSGVKRISFEGMHYRKDIGG